MADADLVASWARPTFHLRAARRCLVAVPDDADRWFEEYLDHNELGLAFEVLTEVAATTDAPQECWSALSRAADEMHLTDEDEAVRLVRNRVG